MLAVAGACPGRAEAHYRSVPLRTPADNFCSVTSEWSANPSSVVPPSSALPQSVYGKRTILRRNKFAFQPTSLVLGRAAASVHLSAKITAWNLPPFRSRKSVDRTTPTFGGVIVWQLFRLRVRRGKSRRITVILNSNCVCNWDPFLHIVDDENSGGQSARPTSRKVYLALGERCCSRCKGDVNFNEPGWLQDFAV